MKLSPNSKRNLNRIIPFAVIWLITGYIFLFIETIATDNSNPFPDEAITLNAEVFLFASFALIFVGLIVGFVELVVLEKRFKYYSLGKKIIYKFLIYLLLMMVLVIITFNIATSIELERSLFDIEVWRKFKRFLGSEVFLSTSIQLSFQLILSLLYAAISENLGHNVLFNFFTGKYHKPKEEERIFMFLDMKDSTPIAEKLGPNQYFNLLQDYYELMSLSIINHLGEVYQYIGDEVVISWELKKGIANNNCIKVFFSIKEKMKVASQQFEKKYGLVPDFKAGLHLGKVTSGEIGALKKEIVFTGDVLNTAARIQGLCKSYNSDLLASDEVLTQIASPEQVISTEIGDIELKGKAKIVKLASVIGIQ